MNPTTTKKPYTFDEGEKLPSIGSDAYKQAQLGIKPTGSYNTTITADNLTNDTQLFKLPEQQVTGTATKIIESAPKITADIKANQEADSARQLELEKAQKERQTLQKGYLDVMAELGLQGERRADLLQEARIPDLTKDVNELYSQMEAKQLSARREIENLDKTFSGTTAGKLDAIRTIEKNSAREMADLAIVLNAKNRNLATAQSFVNQKIELETEDLKNRAETLKFFYQENKEFLNKQDEREFAKLTKQADREYEEGKKKIARLEDTKFKLLESAASQGADNTVLTAIQNSTTPEEAIINAGRYTGNITEMEIKKAQLAQLVNKGEITPEQAKKQIELQESAYEKTKQNLDSVNEAVNNFRGLQITTSNFGGLGRFLSKVGNLGQFGRDEKGRTVKFDKGGISQANEFLASATYILDNLTFDNLLKLKAGGATFGALSEGELRAIGNSADVLSGYAIRDDKGKIVGFRGDENTVLEKLKDIQTKYQKALDKQNAADALNYEELTDPILYQ